MRKINFIPIRIQLHVIIFIKNFSEIIYSYYYLYYLYLYKIFYIIRYIKFIICVIRLIFIFYLINNISIYLCIYFSDLFHLSCSNFFSLLLLIYSFRIYLLMKTLCIETSLSFSLFLLKDNKLYYIWYNTSLLLIYWLTTFPQNSLYSIYITKVLIRNHIFNLEL